MFVFFLNFGTVQAFIDVINIKHGLSYLSISIFTNDFPLNFHTHLANLFLRLSS